MNILSKFGKYLTHVVTNVLEKETIDEKYIEYYEHIYKTCSVQFNTDTKNLYRIYLGLLEIIKLDIEILLIRTNHWLLLQLLEPRKADIQRADLCLRLTLYAGLRHPAFS